MTVRHLATELPKLNYLRRASHQVGVGALRRSGTKERDSLSCPAMVTRDAPLPRKGLGETGGSTTHKGNAGTCKPDALRSSTRE